MTEIHLVNQLPIQPHIWNFLTLKTYPWLKNELNSHGAILIFICLKSETHLLSFINFLLPNITGLELAEKPFFNILKWHNLVISLFSIYLSSSFTLYDVMENGDLSITSISTSKLGHMSISSLKLNASLYLYNLSIDSSFSF